MKAESLLIFFTRLTERQQEVVELASAGLSNREISARLHLSAASVADHLTNVYDRLHCTDDNGLADRPNRGVVIRYFTLLYARYPHLRQFDDLPTLT